MKDIFTCCCLILAMFIHNYLVLIGKTKNAEEDLKPICSIRCDISLAVFSIDHGKIGIKNVLSSRIIFSNQHSRGIVNS